MEAKGSDWTVEAASEWLGQLLAEEPVSPPVNAASRSRFLRVCSVLASFPAAGLRSDEGPIAEAELRDALRNDLASLPRFAGEAERFGLRPAARGEGLAMLGSLGRMLAQRDLNRIEPVSVTQQVLDEYIEENFSAAKSDDVERLQAALQVSEWLRDYAPAMPAAAAIEKRLALRRLLQPMERLTSGFMGRGDQLATLRQFVGVLDARSTAEAFVRFLRRVTPRRSTLMLSGIGGVGKSTLLAEFILQHAKSPIPFPWVYLDFDNPRLNVATLSTILEEAVAQLVATYPESDWEDLLWQARKRSATAGAATYDSEAPDRALGLGDVELSERLHIDSARALASQFAWHLRRAVAGSEPEGSDPFSGDLPFLLVLDTFEEVQKRGIEMANVLWQFLRALQGELPKLRIVVAGRAQVPELHEHLPPIEDMEVPEFDELSALSFLNACGIEDTDVARSLYKQVAGNPLSLKLAAQVAKLEGSGGSGIVGLKTSSFLVFAAAEHVIQGQLYRRILDRIADPELQKLAHPGLVVRRVIPSIIRDVLAEPCGLGEIDDEQAERLFDELKKQVDLVVVQLDGSLRHQQALRRVMLKLLESERPEQARQIHGRAFRFYEHLADLSSRTERLYHALQLGDQEAEIRSIWSSEAAESLLSSIDELPPASQLLVYELAKRQPPPELRSLANLDQWERLVEGKARRALQYNDYKTVRALIEERKERTAGSGLYAIEALLWFSTGDDAAALRKIEEGIASAQKVNRIDRLVELLRLRGELFERQERYGEADASMAEAQSLSLRIASPVLALQILAGRARLSRPALPLSSQSGYVIPGAISSAEVEEVVKLTSDADFAAVRLQLRGLFRRYGPISLPLLFKGLRIFQLKGAPRIREQVPWLGGLNEMAEQGRANEFLQTLLEREPEDLVNRTVVAGILEDALDPSQGSRAR